jgi:hypothetical protein
MAEGGGEAAPAEAPADEGAIVVVKAEDEEAEGGEAEAAGGEGGEGAKGAAEGGGEEKKE